MSQSLSVQGLYDALQSRLRLQWPAGRGAAGRSIDTRVLHSSAYAMAGYLNVIRPSQITVIANAECRYLSELEASARRSLLEQLFDEPTVMVIVAGGKRPPEGVEALADESGIALLTTPRSGNETLNNLRYFLSYALAESLTLHGVFLEVNGIGLMITGDSGLGKSELALELITRGQRLIADDAPEFARIAPDLIEGSCPELLSGFLEVRGLGILNIRTMFGDSAVKRRKYLRLIVNLVPLDHAGGPELDRLGSISRYRKVLNVDIPEITLPVAPGRNLAVLVEAAALAHTIALNGYNAADDFIQRQQRLMRGGAR